MTVASDVHPKDGSMAADGMRLDIVVHPARRRPRTTVFLLLYLTLTSWLMARFSSPALGLSVPACAGLVMLAFVVLLRRWFFPTRYRFDDDGVEVSGFPPRRYPWSRFRSWRRERAGWTLSPFSDPRRFDHFRGLFMPLDKSARATAAPRRTVATERDGEPPPRSHLGGASLRDDLDTTLQALLKEKIDGRTVPVA